MTLRGLLVEVQRRRALLALARASKRSRKAWALWAAYERAAEDLKARAYALERNKNDVGRK